jgi:hypothetical protein
MNYLWIMMILAQGAAWASETGANVGSGEGKSSEQSGASQKQPEPEGKKGKLTIQHRFIIPDGKIQELVRNGEQRQQTEPKQLEQPRSKEEFFMSLKDTMDFAKKLEENKQKQETSQNKAQAQQDKSRMGSLDAVQKMAEETYGIGRGVFTMPTTPKTQSVPQPQNVPTEAELKAMHEKARALEEQANKMFPDPKSPYDSLKDIGLPGGRAPKADQEAQNVQKVNDHVKKDFEAKKAAFGRALAKEKEALKGLLGFKSLSAERQKGLEEVSSHLEELHSKFTSANSPNFTLEKLNKAIDKAQKSGSFFDKLFERKKLEVHNQALESMRTMLTHHYQKLQQAHDKVKTVEAVRG